MAKAPTRRNGQALPGAFGLSPGKMRLASTAGLSRKADIPVIGSTG
ncbi:MAG: hypothetical protein ACU0DI_10200 [Paracoccaceae bacterium]